MTWLSPLTFAALTPLWYHYVTIIMMILWTTVRDGELWNLWYTSVPAPGGVHEEIERRLSLLNQNAMLPFAVIENATNKAVG